MPAKASAKAMKMLRLEGLFAGIARAYRAPAPAGCAGRVMWLTG